MVRSTTSKPPLSSTYECSIPALEESQSVAPTENITSPDMVPLDVKRRVLLSPPPIRQSSEAFGVAQDESPERMRALLDEQARRNNYTAYLGNAQTSRVNGRPEIDRVPFGDVLHALHITTDMPPSRHSGSSHSMESQGRIRHSMSSSSIPRRIPSIRTALHSSAGSLSPGSVLTSPQIAALLDMTPLPSPTLTTSHPWGLVRDIGSRRSSTASRSEVITHSPAPSKLSPVSPSRRKAYPNLRPGSEPSYENNSETALGGSHGDSHNRSVSDYVPEALAVPKPRYVAVSSSTGPVVQLTQSQANMHYDERLVDSRGLIAPDAAKLPLTGGLKENTDFPQHMTQPLKVEQYHVHNISGGQARVYNTFRLLGQGTFSKVYLAVRQPDGQGTNNHYSTTPGAMLRANRLVAIKVVEHGPAGGADVDRIEVSLQREVEIMKAIRHPSLVHLKALGSSETAQALLVMSYCPGGDLLQLASTRFEFLTPTLIRRIFAELVSAICYLHSKCIVHRDLKLENILLNIPIDVHRSTPEWQTFDQAVITVTDLGLSRRMPDLPESPLLTTRCGSEDYAAPELLMGKPYDGRQTDAWSLGVVLYSLVEGRLPFDPIPGARGDPAVLRARTAHRIARIEWAWCRFGDDDGDWDPNKGGALDGAKTCVEGLLERHTRRKSLHEIQQIPWVRDGIMVQGGLRVLDNDDDDDDDDDEEMVV